MGEACIFISVFSIITLKYPDKKRVYIAWCNGFGGLGAMLGPIVGQGAYTVTDYRFDLTFYLFSSLYFIFLPIVIFYIPKSINVRGSQMIDIK